MKKGILVTIMGVTNIGKTTQIELLKERFLKEGLKFKTLKYPVYDLPPTGPRIYDFLKGGNPEKLSAREFQELCAQNRKDFEPELKKMLTENDIVVAEMYTGTGIAYGMGDGVSKDYLFEINKGILEPDVSILLNGRRYLESKEVGHIYENNDDMTEIIKGIHLQLAFDMKWSILNANLPKEELHEDIWEIISRELKTPTD